MTKGILLRGYGGKVIELPEDFTPLRIVEGFFHFRPFYDKLIEEAPEGATVVEIGVYQGMSLIYLATKRPDLRVVGVDWGLGQVELPEGKEPSANTLLLNMQAARIVDRVPIILIDSPKAAQFFDDGECWAVFIDGDHSYEGVKRDLEAWGPKVMKGGYISGDDYGCPGWEGVKKAVDEAFGGELIETQAPYTWWRRV